MKIQYLPEDQEVINAYVRLLNDRREDIMRCGMQSMNYGSMFYDNLQYSDIVKSIINDPVAESIRQDLYRFIATRPYTILNLEDETKRLIFAGGV